MSIGDHVGLPRSLCTFIYHSVLLQCDKVRQAHVNQINKAKYGSEDVPDGITMLVGASDFLNGST